MYRRIVGLILLLLVAVMPISVAAERFTLLTGTGWETEGCIADSGQPGPVALILGGAHGNEPAGALAAAQICTLRPVTGKIVVVPRVNRPGLAAKVRYVLDGGGDMNRVYPPRGVATPAERMGAAIIALMEEHRIRLFVDLHEARNFHKLDPSSLGQSLLPADNPASDAMATAAIEAVNREIKEEMKQFVRLGPPIRRSAAWYAGKYLGIAAFTVETSGQQPLADRVGQHLAVVRELLIAGGWLARPEKDH
jgi:predicted deacylase